MAENSIGAVVTIFKDLSYQPINFAYGRNLSRSRTWLDLKLPMAKSKMATMHAMVAIGDIVLP